MYANTAYLNNHLPEVVDNSKPLIVTSCGNYKMKSRPCFETNHARLLSEYDYPKDWQRRNAEEFTEWIKTFKGDSLEIKDNHFLSMKNVTLLVMKEMSQMKDEVLMFAYKKSIKPSLEWLLEQIPKVDGIFQYAFIVDKAKLPESVCEPNYALEDFVRRMIKTLGDGSIICRELLNLLDREGYSLFYNGNCGIKDFIKNARISK